MSADTGAVLLLYGLALLLLGSTLAFVRIVVRHRFLDRIADMKVMVTSDWPTASERES